VEGDTVEKKRGRSEGVRDRLNRGGRKGEKERQEEGSQATTQDSVR
jgi:hypothetical protein